jgi:hypothetical protein
MDVYSTDLGIRLSFIKTSEFGGGGGTTTTPRYATGLGLRCPTDGSTKQFKKNTW